MRFVIAGLTCVGISVAGYADSKVKAGTILGVNQYWQNSEVVSATARGSNQYIANATMSFDTVNFDTCALRCGVAVSPAIRGVQAALRPPPVSAEDVEIVNSRCSASYDLRSFYRFTRQ